MNTYISLQERCRNVPYLLAYNAQSNLMILKGLRKKKLFTGNCNAQPKKYSNKNDYKSVI